MIEQMKTTKRISNKMKQSWVMVLMLIQIIIVSSCSKDDDDGRVKNNATELVSFVFTAASNESLTADVSGDINHDSHTISMTVPFGTNVTSLTPTVEVTQGAHYSPAGAQDFSSVVTYTVTAENGTTDDYDVMITIAEDPAIIQRAALIALDEANPENSLAWNTSSDISTWDEVTVNEDGLITELDLGNRKITILPDEIKNLSSLEYLDVSFNQLTALPEGISSLSSLKWLYAYNNQLTSLPENIGNLTSLVDLYISDNQLESLPKSLGNLSSLERIAAFNNQLTSLPGEIGNLSSLVYLMVYNNKLTSLPESLVHLENLDKLRIQDNDIVSISTELCAFIKGLTDYSSNDLDSGLCP